MPESDQARMPGRTEFVLLIAAMMASNALGIDAMLPALPAIGESLGVADENRRQLVITFYMLGFGGAQLAYGPLADRFGRKRLLIGCMIFYAGFAALSGLASSFALLLAARTLHGVSAAGAPRAGGGGGARPVRRRGDGADHVDGDDRVHDGAGAGAEPRPGRARDRQLAAHLHRARPLRPAACGLGRAAGCPRRWRMARGGRCRRAISAPRSRETLSTRVSIGNTAAMTVTFGGLLGYVGSIQQVIFDVFHRPALIGIVFACVAVPMAMSSWLNSRLVMRFGSRRLLLSALAIFTCFAVLHLAIILTMGETIWWFVLLQALTMGWFGLVGSNAGALAMEPLGHIAGTASALQGLISTIGAALIGLLIGQMFNGTTVPLVAGFVCCGALGLAIAWWANAGLPAHSRNELSEPVEPPLA